MIQLSVAHQQIVRKILSDQLKDHRVYFFGSRVKNSANKYSDLDICLDGPSLSFSEISALKDAFSESDLPYFVDIVQKQSMDDSFYSLVKEDLVAFEIQ